MEAISARCLLGACASGANDNAWREFIRRFRKGLESGVRSGLRRLAYDAPKDEIEDLLQEIYCRLLESDGRRLRATRGTTDGEIGSYLRRLAENVVSDRVRAARAAKRQSSVVRSLSGVENALADPAPSHEQTLLAREDAQRVLRVGVGRRMGSERSAWIARKALLEGWTSAEIARALRGGVTTGAVDAVLSRVYRRLRAAGVRLPRRRGERRAPDRSAARGNRQTSPRQAGAAG